MVYEKLLMTIKSCYRLQNFEMMHSRVELKENYSGILKSFTINKFHIFLNVIPQFGRNKIKHLYFELNCKDVLAFESSCLLVFSH